MDEAELVQACQQGDQAAFAELVTANRGIAWSVCLSITGNPYDAEDALQETLILAWQKIDKFHGQSRFRTWFYRVAANTATSYVRRRRDEPIDSVPDLADIATPTTADRVVTVDSVRRAIAELPVEYRETIVLREFADLTYNEIAAHQGIPVQTVRSRISRARSQLLETLSAAS